MTSSDLPRERLLALGPRALADAELLALVLGSGTAGLSARAAALGLLDGTSVAELAWAPPASLAAAPGLGLARAAALAAAFELGRRGAWDPPGRGERCLDPRRVHERIRTTKRVADGGGGACYFDEECSSISPSATWR